ncbi:unnamed protein product [Prorocentrum cordatum]|nr:unnamed protein product [Polarella glacialis]
MTSSTTVSTKTGTSSSTGTSSTTVLTGTETSATTRSVTSETSSKSESTTSEISTTTASTTSMSGTTASTTSDTSSWTVTSSTSISTLSTKTLTSFTTVSTASKTSSTTVSTKTGTSSSTGTSSTTVLTGTETSATTRSVTSETSSKSESTTSEISTTTASTTSMSGTTASTTSDTSSWTVTSSTSISTLSTKTLTSFTTVSTASKTSSTTVSTKTGTSSSTATTRSVTSETSSKSESTTSEISTTTASTTSMSGTTASMTSGTSSRTVTSSTQTSSKSESTTSETSTTTASTTSMSGTTASMTSGTSSRTVTSSTQTSSMSVSTNTESYTTTATRTSGTSATTLSTSSETSISSTTGTTITDTSSTTGTTQSSTTTGTTTTKTSTTTVSATSDSSTTTGTSPTRTSTKTGTTTSKSSRTTVSTTTESSTTTEISTSETSSKSGTMTSKTSSATMSSSTSLTISSGTISTTISSTTETSGTTTATSSTTASSTSRTSTSTASTSSLTSSTTSSTTSETSSASISSTSVTATATIERLSEIRSTLRLTFGTNVSTADAAAAAQCAVASYLNTSESLVVIDAVTVNQAGVSRSGRGARALSSLAYEIAYILLVGGSDIERQEARLTELFHDTSAIASTLQVVVAQMGLPTITSVVATMPEIRLWSPPTATHTSTTDLATSLPELPMGACVGGPDLPIGYEFWDPGCVNMSYLDVCNISCSDGYENLGGPAQIVCSAPAGYSWVNGSGACTEKSCYADSVPDMLGVASASSCVGTASGTSCSPVCNDSYELIEPMKCNKGHFDELPLMCVPSNHAETLEVVDTFLIEMTIATNESQSGLTAEWARSAGGEAALKSSIGKTLGLLQGQIFLKGQKDLTSDWGRAVPARRLTTSQGLFFEVVLQPYPIDNVTDLEHRILALGGGNFTHELDAALRSSGTSALPGLAAATLVVGAPAQVSFTLPVARWVALGDWTLCSNLCGPGVRTRPVECLGAWGGDAVDLCNANAAPGFTMESYMPASEPCEQYISCAYDWSCPGGPDPVTGEGCEAQASGVAVALSVTLLCCVCLLCRLARRRYKMSMLANILWTREGGIDDGGGNLRQTSDTAPTAATNDMGSVTSTSNEFFHKGQTVDYWSGATKTWLPAEILDVRDASYDIRVGAAEQTVHGVSVKDLRVPFDEVESASVHEVPPPTRTTSSAAGTPECATTDDGPAAEERFTV